MDGKGVLLISLCLVLLQVPSLVQTQEEASELRNAEQENAASSLDLIRKQVTEAVQTRQPMWKRNEALTTSNNRLLELIAQEVQWFANARTQSLQLAALLKKLEFSAKWNLSEGDQQIFGCGKTEQIRTNDNTLEEHRNLQFPPLSPDDIQVTLHDFLPKSTVNNSDDVTDIPEDLEQAERSNRKRRTTELPVPIIDVLLTLHERTENNGNVTNVTGTGNSLEHFQTLVSIPGLEKTPVRRNEQLQNLNLHLQKIYIKVTEEQRVETGENYKLQEILMKLIEEREDAGRKLLYLYQNQTRHYEHLLEMQKNMSRENNILKKRLEYLENERDNTQKQEELLYPDKDNLLLEASKTGNSSAVVFLIAIHANLSASDENNRTPLHLAAKNNHVDIARALLNAGADPEDKDDRKNTALHLAAESAEPEMIKLLVSSGSKLESRNEAGETPLYVAARVGNLEAVRQLVKFNSNVIVRNSEGLTALHMAASRGDKQMTTELVRAGAFVDDRDRTGNTPLHIAALHGHLDVCEALLDASAGVRLSTSERQTPLHLAALAGHLPVVQLLLERGADAKARNMRGRTPAGVAARKGHKDIVSFLSKH